jgi:hypothetical protein
VGRDLIYALVIIVLAVIGAGRTPGSAESEPIDPSWI